MPVVPVMARAETMQQQQQEEKMVMSGRGGRGDQSANPMVLAWLKSEFAAANAMIDAFCAHVLQLSKMQNSDDHVHDYDQLLAAVYRRRINWIPILHMQKYFSIADVSFQLQRILDNKMAISNGHHQSDNTITTPSSGPRHEEEELEKVLEENDHKDEQPELIQREGEDVNELQLQRQEDRDRDFLQGQSSPKSTSSNSVSILNPPTRCEDGAPTTIENGGTATANDGHSSGSSQEEDDHSSTENFSLCSDHEECTTRRERIDVLKGFSAKESIKGRMVNVVKGMKVYEGVFKDLELSKLGEYIQQLRAAGREGRLPGETYTFFNKELKGNRRETIQLGIPLFQPTNGKATSRYLATMWPQFKIDFHDKLLTGPDGNVVQLVVGRISKEKFVLAYKCAIEPIPPILRGVINHLLQWRLLPQSKQPSSCIISFFDEEEHSQPYFKPPHLDNPISTLFLHETKMAFGRALMSDNSGNFKGSLTLSLKQGSFLVLRGNSADKARHVVCPSENARISITFARVRPSPPSSNQQADSSPISAKVVAAAAAAVPIWMPDDEFRALGCPGVVPPSSSWRMAVQPAPFLMLAPPLEPVIPMTLVEAPPVTAADNLMGHDAQNDGSVVGIGTGVYLPWMLGGSNKLLKGIPPPRFHKGRPPSMAQVPLGKGSPSPASCPLSSH